MQQQCHLEEALGRNVACPEERCAFWKEGCAISAMRPEFATNPSFAGFLADLRGRIERLSPTPPRSDHALLPPGLRCQPRIHA